MEDRRYMGDSVGKYLDSFGSAASEEIKRSVRADPAAFVV
jgi:hypothetical protein